MSALDFVFTNSSLENPATSVSEYLEWNGLPYGPSSSAGVRVTRESALRFHPVWRGVNLISDYIGKLPLYIYERVGEKGKKHAFDHPSYSKLLYEPNGDMNAFHLKKIAESHRTLEGNGYIFCRRNRFSEIQEYILLDPRQTWPMRVGGQMFYLTHDTTTGEAQLLAREDVIHLKGLGYDGLQGYSWTWMAGESVGAGIAKVAYDGAFFRNNALPACIIEVPGTMKPEAKAELARNWNALHAGVGSAHKLGVMTGGMKLHTVSINAKDSQLVESEKWDIIAIANLLGLPPHKLGASERIAYNSLEQENQAFLDDDLDWRLVDWEQEVRRKVLTEADKKQRRYIIQFDRNELVRPDISARGEYNSKSTGGKPWQSINDVRMNEGLNPLPDKRADEVVPEDPEPMPPPAPVEADEDGKPAVPLPPNKKAQAALLGRSCRRMAERIAQNTVRRAKTRDGFVDWLDEMAGHSRSVMVEEFCAVLAVCDTETTSEGLADSLLALAESELLDLGGQITGNGLVGAVKEWATRFCGETVDRLVAEVLEAKERVAA